MSGISVPVVVIGKSERDHYLEDGYNPPKGEFQKDAFLAECRAANEKVRGAVEKHWKHWSIESPYAMDKETRLCRKTGLFLYGGSVHIDVSIPDTEVKDDETSPDG